MKISIAQMLFLTAVAAVLVVLTRPLWIAWDWHRFFCGFIATMYLVGIAPVEPEITDWTGVAGFTGAFFGMAVTSVACVLSLYGGVQFYAYLGTKSSKSA